VAIVNGYATLAEVKARLDIPTATTTYDTVLENVVEAASRWIDAWVSRTFYATTATRYFTPDTYTTLFLRDDLQSVTSIKTESSSSGGTRTYGYTWSATDYDLEPYDGPPYTRIVMNPTGLYSFPLTTKSVEVVGTWGYCATGSHPDAINEACLRQASRLFERNKAPLGMIGDGQTSQATRYSDRDPDVMVLLAPYRRMELVGA
jgi:hypothetical protein